MSKILDDMRKEANIQGAIEAYRRTKMADSDILAEIMDQFNLTKEEAQNYMLQESA